LTLTEAIRVFELAIENRAKCSGAAYWLEVERKEYLLPGRKGDVLRAFWKEHSKTGLEPYIRTAPENKIRYSHMREHIPEIKQISLNTAQLKIMDPTKVEAVMEPISNNKAPAKQTPKEKLKHL
jgi:hypothetical protein